MRQPYIGGQAVLEGVMMRSPKSFVVAVRQPDGTIAVREQEWQALLPNLGFLRWPLFRGALVLAESLHNGFVALEFSAARGLPPEAGASKDAEPSAGSRGLMGIAVLAMLGVFIAAPHLLAYGAAWALGVDPKGTSAQLLDGFFRVTILVGYISLIARTEQARRLFAYHGAEHKAIWAYESSVPLDVAHAKAFSRQHPRCGTSFLFVVVLVAVLVHAALVPFIPQLAASGAVHQLMLVPVKILLAFPIAGIAYELQKLSAREVCPAPIRWATKPGMWLQNLTTREPDDSQLEIALVALARALAREEGKARAPEGIAVYPDFGVAAA